MINVVYDKEIKKLEGFKDSSNFHFIDISTKKGQREGRQLMNHWGARITPFIIDIENGQGICAFYSESKRDICNELIRYLNDRTNN